jgi:hypothetical protein
MPFLSYCRQTLTPILGYAIITGGAVYVTTRVSTGAGVFVGIAAPATAAGLCMICCGGYAFGSVILARFPVLNLLVLKKRIKADGI